MGDTDGAYSRLEELEGNKPQETKVEEVDFESKIEEEVRKRMEAQGLLTTETGTPAGGSSVPAYTRKEIEEMDHKEFVKLFPGGMTEFIDKATRGEIALLD